MYLVGSDFILGSNHTSRTCSPANIHLEEKSFSRVSSTDSFVSVYADGSVGNHQLESYLVQLRGRLADLNKKRGCPR